MQNASPSGGSEQTFRFIVKPTVSGKLVSFHFSNTLGAVPITIGAAHVGIATAGRASVTGDVPLTFSGKPSVTLAPGAAISSDRLAFSYPYGSLLAITEYLSGTWTSIPDHGNGSLWTNYETASGAGDKTADSAGTTFTKTTTDQFLFDRIDVTGNYKETVAFIGSSTTEGVGATAGQYNTFIDDIAANLHASGIDTIGLANVAIVPDSLLPQDDVSGNQSAIERFGRDVLSLPGVTILVQNAADIDLKSATDCVTAQTIISGEEQMVAAAHGAGLKIFLAVIAPSTYCGAENPAGYGTRFPAGTGQDLQRNLLNGWIESTTTTTVNGVTEAPPGADAVVDIATPITDPANTGYMLPAYNSGDDSHANAAGQAVQALQFPSSLF